VPAPAAARPAILVFTRTAGFRHASIPAAVAAVRALGREGGLVVEVTENPGVFTDARLRRYRAVVFLHTATCSALERYVAAGGGWVGVHAAADADPGWPWFRGLIGGPRHGCRNGPRHGCRNGPRSAARGGGG
jgi:hypothetical protein